MLLNNSPLLLRFYNVHTTELIDDMTPKKLFIISKIKCRRIFGILNFEEDFF